MSNEDEYRLLTRIEVESRFGVPKRYLELADANGTGPTQVRLGRSVRYRVKDIRQWIDRNSTETGS